MVFSERPSKKNLNKIQIHVLIKSSLISSSNWSNLFVSNSTLVSIYKKTRFFECMENFRPKDTKSARVNKQTIDEHQVISSINTKRQN